MRRYKFFDTQKNTSILGKSKKSNFSQPWKTNRNSDLGQNGFANFHPPSDEQVRQYYQSCASKSTGSKQEEMMNDLNIPRAYTYSDVTQNGRNVAPSLRNVAGKSTGSEQYRMMSNVNVPRMYNYGDVWQNSEIATPSMILQNGNQHLQFPQQPAFRAEEVIRGGHFQ